MPNFQVSLRDSNNDVALSVVGTTIQIDDYSNYIASTEAGHLLASFDFKYIEITNINDNTVYRYCTNLYSWIDAQISAPKTYTNPALYPPISTNYTFTDSGVYSVRLISVPTLDKVVAYDIGDTIITNQKIYISTANNNTTAPGTPGASWIRLVDFTGTNAELEILDISSKYNTVEYIAVSCSLEECFADLVYQVNCIEMSVSCDDEKLCENSTWRKAMRMSMILDSLQTLVNRGDYNQAQVSINAAQAICSCCQ